MGTLIGMVQLVAPMLATPGVLPAPSPAWRYEAKLDGQRGMIVCDNGVCRVLSRTLRDISDTYPDVVTAVEQVVGGRRIMLDGEIVVIDPATRAPDFGMLQQRMHARPTLTRLARAPAVFAAFDLLHLDNHALTGERYLNRRELLEGLDLGRGRVQVPPNWGPETDPRELMAALVAAGHEGAVAKRADSTYRSGRSPAWQKQVARSSFDAVVAGWLPGTGAYPSTVGSLVLAGYGDDGGLHYMGLVGAGLSDRARSALKTALSALARPDPPVQTPRPVAAAAYFCDPVVVAVVEAREVSAEGILRHPAFKGVRADVDPDAVKVPVRGM